MLEKRVENRILKKTGFAIFALAAGFLVQSGSSPDMFCAEKKSGVWMMTCDANEISEKRRSAEETLFLSMAEKEDASNKQTSAEAVSEMWTSIASISGEGDEKQILERLAVAAKDLETSKDMKRRATENEMRAKKALHDLDEKFLTGTVGALGEFPAFVGSLLIEKRVPIFIAPLPLSMIFGGLTTTVLFFMFYAMGWVSKRLTPVPLAKDKSDEHSKNREASTEKRESMTSSNVPSPSAAARKVAVAARVISSRIEKTRTYEANLKKEKEKATSF